MSQKKPEPEYKAPVQCPFLRAGANANTVAYSNSQRRDQLGACLGEGCALWKKAWKGCSLRDNGNG